MKATKAQESGRLAKEIVNVEIPQRKKDPIIFANDEFIKPTTTPEILAKLRGAFIKEGGSVTAGNASGLNDGAAATIIASEDAVKKYGLKKQFTKNKRKFLMIYQKTILTPSSMEDN